MKRDIYKTCLNLALLLTSFSVFNCSITKQNKVRINKEIDFQGHRGCRGLLPENTIPAFEKALEYVTTLEMDVVISKDKKVIISHEAYMSSKICSHPDGSPVSSKEEKELNIYALTYQEIKGYDCGKRGNPKHRSQKKMECYKPSLMDMVQHIESHCIENNLPAPWYDIEIKSEEELYNKMQPEPEEFVRLILKELDDLGVIKRTNLQSFDINILEEIKKQDPKMVIAYLVDKPAPLETHLKKISFKPDIFSPEFKFVTKKMCDKCHDKNIKVIPWTVNKWSDMESLIEKGVDGIITDYPNLIVR